MAETIVAETPANPDTRKMDAREYLEFLNQLERVGWRLANDTRAYLVTLDPTGSRIVQPVRFDCSVLNLDKELATHLKEAMVSTETLREVREVCTQRLKERKEPEPPTLDAQRHAIAQDATYEVQVLALMLRKMIDQGETGADMAAAGRGILTRISDLSDILYEAVIQDEEERDDIPTLRRKLGLG